MATAPIQHPVSYDVNAGRADIDYKSIESLLNTRSVEVTWEQRARCPCTSQHSTGWGGEFTTPSNQGSARPDCPVCRGRGWYYHSARTIPAVIQGASANEALATEAGRYSNQNIRVTTHSVHRFGPFDQFTMPAKFYLPFDEVHEAKDSAVTVLNPPAFSVVDTADPANPAEPLPTTAAIRRVIVADDSGQVVLDGGEPRVYVLGADFTVSDSTLTFSTPVPDGYRVSVSYYGRMRYRVTSVEHAHRHTRHLDVIEGTDEVVVLPNTGFAQLVELG